MVWTHFWDMHSGGGQKLDWAHIYIEAPADEAKAIFFARFGRNPEKVTCTCCGPDYSISTEEDLAQLTGYHRGCEGAYVMEDGSERSEEDWYSLSRDERIAMNERFRYMERQATSLSMGRSYCTLDEYMKRPDVTFVPASHITPEERRAKVPAQGYVWVE